MNPSYDSEGFLLKVDSKFGYGRKVSLTKWNEKLYLHINDNTKCWDNGKYDKTKAKSLSLKWTDAVHLKDCLQQLEPFAQQIQSEQYLGVPMKQTQSVLVEPFEAEPRDKENMPPVQSTSGNDSRHEMPIFPLPKYRRYQPY